MDKYYDGISTLVIGIFFSFLGIILLVGGEALYRYIIEIIVIVFLGRVILDLVKYVFLKNKRYKNKFLLSWFFHFCCCIIFCLVPSVSLGILPIIFSIYLMIGGLGQLLQCFLEIRDKVYVHFNNLFIGLIYIYISLIIFINPVKGIDTFILCLSIYVILLGINYILYTLERVVSVKDRNRFKRRIRITLPKIVEAIIPYSVMMEINRNLGISNNNKYNLYDNSDDIDLHILIHTSNRGSNRMGHMDIIYDGLVYSYGNYDEGSRRFNEFFGDGVLFTTDKIREYINFCIDNSGKTIFDFGIKINDIENVRIKKRIKELCSYTYFWNYFDDLKYNNGSSYASKLYNKTKAKFYKFSKTKYKSYFVLGTNCCFLVDDIVGNSGMDILSINGIITPGTYYDYLNREYRLKKSRVVFKDIYNKDRRP